jgi:murein DD-endopeptidase MepM/ murein hydrolase activator NlpD
MDAHCGGGFGNNIVIQHKNGYTTRYAHLQKIYVVRGSQVQQGQLIAGMGNTGHV